MNTAFELEAVFSEPHERTPSVSGSFSDGATLCEVGGEGDATAPAESAANKISATNSNSLACSSEPAIARVGSPLQTQPTLAPPYPSPRKAGKDMSAYSLFLLGHDTFEISQRLGIPEHVVLKGITIARDMANNTFTEFEGQLP